VTDGGPVDLRALEGRHVGLALSDGSRIDECQLVSAGRGHVERVWICVDGTDRFLAARDIRDAWESAARPRRVADGGARLRH
jgi:hypothetical protein